MQTSHLPPRLNGERSPGNLQNSWPLKGTFTGLPTFFKIHLRQTKSRCGSGYRHLGVEFAQVVCRLVPDDFDGAQQQWADLVEAELCPLLQLYANDESRESSPVTSRVISWFHRRFPILANQIPTGKWNNFISGMTLVYLDGEMV
jgi:hypothetical protein